MAHWERESEKFQKSVTYYLNGPLTHLVSQGDWFSIGVRSCWSDNEVVWELKPLGGSKGIDVHRNLEKHTFRLEINVDCSNKDIE